MSMRIGIDVGGTNTDAALISGGKVLAALKLPTTPDVTTGILNGLDGVVAKAGISPAMIDTIVIGTTHFTNAVVERRDLERVAAIRICLPASASIPPAFDWPADLRGAIDPMTFLIGGGHEHDGRPIAPFDEQAVRDAARKIQDSGIVAVAVTSTFSPLRNELELRAREIINEVHPEALVTLSHDIGRIGILERENATLLNACLAKNGLRTIAAFREALALGGYTAPFFVSQNDGTVMLADMAARFPVFSFASGPTNSLRGAAYLSGRENATVIDVGGTTSDIGILQKSDPREANGLVRIGGVRTMFRMPDVLSVGIGGGSLVDLETATVGPRTVGYRISSEALVFGGQRLTLTDIAVAAGLVRIGDPSKVRHIGESSIRQVQETVKRVLEDGIDRMKLAAGDTTVIAVGGGGFIVPRSMAGVDQVIDIEHGAVANAIGAATGMVAGEVDQIFSDVTLSQATAQAEELARKRAVQAGADPTTLKLTDIDDIPVAYMPGNARRVRVRVIGTVAGTQAAGA